MGTKPIPINDDLEARIEGPDTMPSDPKKVRDILKLYLQMRRGLGLSYVSSKEIRRHLDWDPLPTELAVHLRELRQRGCIEPVTSQSPRTYRILTGGGNDE